MTSLTSSGATSSSIPMSFRIVVATGALLTPTEPRWPQTPTPFFHAESDRWTSSPVNRRLYGFAALPSDWDSYGASPIQPLPIRLATALLSALGPMTHGLSAQPVPTSDGGVQLEWHGANGVLEIEIAPDGRCGVFVSDLDGSSSREALLSDVFRELPKLFEGIS